MKRHELPPLTCRTCHGRVSPSFVLGTADRHDKCRKCIDDEARGPREPLQAPPITAALMVHNTPWGAADYRRMIAPGVVFCSTPSHGGALVSAELQQLIPPTLRTVDGWYEEDCELAAVIVTWPDYFNAETCRIARAQVATGRDFRMNRTGRPHPDATRAAGQFAHADGVTHD